MNLRNLATPRLDIWRPGPVALIAAAAIGLWLAATAAVSKSATAAEKRPPNDPAHSTEGHAREATALKKVMTGPVDIYFEPAQLSAAKPGIAGAKFVDLVDVTGKELLRFDRDGKEQWLVDPDAVLAFRISKER